MCLQLINSLHHPADNKAQSTGVLNFEHVLSFEFSPTSQIHFCEEMVIGI